MTPKFSLVTLVAGAALVFAVPAAFGEGKLAGSLEPAMAKAMAEDGFDHAVAAKLALQSKAGAYRDANERPGATKPAVQSSVSRYRDAFERTGVKQELGSSVAGYRDANERVVVQNQGLESSVGTYRDANERVVGGRPESSVPVSDTSIGSGREIEWPQIGIGFGIGILLGLGLWLAMRTRIRPLAH
jgi:hypothetical protein